MPDTQSPLRSLVRRKSVLLAGVVALGLTGVLAGEALLTDSTPARAEIIHAQNLSRDNNLRSNEPSQDRIGFADIVETVKPAVVSVRVKTARETSSLEDDLPGYFRDLPEGHPFRRFFEEYGFHDGPRKNRPRRFGQAQGSGFFISADGYVVTNNHVVTDASEVELTTDSGDTLTAKVVGTDPQTDLALLKVDKEGKYPFVSLGKEVPRIGDWVVAIGNPFGLGGTVTAGIVSARGRDLGSGPYDDFLQIDAAVNRGNSGGPTFNLKGEVVGVNTAIYSQSGGNVGIAFAVPSNVVASVIEDLRESGSVTRGWLGVSIQPVEEDMAEALGLEEASGALVAEVHPDTPADEAGIKNRDVVLSLNGQKVADPRELTRMVGGLKPGSSAELEVWRDGKEQEVSVKLGKRPDNPQLARADDNRDGGEEGKTSPSALADFGIQIEPAPEGKGVAVTGVDSDSQVGEKLQAGDVILEVNGEAVSNADEVSAAMNQKENPRFITLRVKSGEGTPRYVVVPVKRD